MPWTHKAIDSSKLSLERSDNFHKVFEETRSQEELSHPHASDKETKDENKRNSRKYNNMKKIFQACTRVLHERLKEAIKNDENIDYQNANPIPLSRIKFPK